MIPGWPYSVIAAVEPGRTSWTLPLDAVRLGPADDATEVTAAQVREVVTRIIDAGHWREGDPGIVVVFDSGYDLTRLAGANGRPSPARCRVQARRREVLARTGRDRRRRDDPVRDRPGHGMEPLHQRLAGRAGWETHAPERPAI